MMNLVQLLLVLILVCFVSGLDGKFDGREMVNGSEKNMAGREIMSKDINANVSSLVDFLLLLLRWKQSEAKLYANKSEYYTTKR